MIFTIIVIFLLQTKPESRPSLSQILQHSFFTRPGIATPTQLPEMALRDVPIFTPIESESMSFKKYNVPTHEVWKIFQKFHLNNSFYFFCCFWYVMIMFYLFEYFNYFLKFFRWQLVMKIILSLSTNRMVYHLK